MKRWWIIGMLLMGCATPKEETPAGVLPRDRFRDVLLEAQLIEARMNHELVVAHHSTIPSEQYYTDMFQAQGTDRDEFQRSFAYWTARPEEMHGIYEEILSELTRRKDERAQ